MNSFTSWHHWSKLHRRHKYFDNEEFSWKKRRVIENYSRRIVHDLNSLTWFIIYLDQIRAYSFQTSFRFVKLENDSTNFWSSNRLLFSMQISRNDDEQSTHLKTSFETSEEKIDQQTEHFNDLDRVHLKNKHRRSSSHLFDHRTVSIHLLCLDRICFQRRTLFQAKKERDFVFHERHLNSCSSNHFRRLQKHRRCDSEHRILFVFYTSTVKHDHIWRAAAFDHQLDLFIHKKSQSATQSIFRSQSNAALAYALCSAKSLTEAED
jgi:hypothetical protein